jgi:hypothetical protein
LVAIFCPLFQFDFLLDTDPASFSMLIDMHFTRQGRRTSAFGQVILFAADASARSLRPAHWLGGALSQSTGDE